MSEHSSTAHWHAEPHPFLVGFGGFFFLPWAFMLQFVYGQSTPAIVVLTIAVLMLLIGGIGWVGATVGIVHDEGWSPSAMIMFIGTEVMTVAGLLVAYWVMRLQTSIWPPEGTPEISPPVLATLILLISSITIGLARKKQLEDDVKGFASLTIVSILIWILFAIMVLTGWSNLSAQGFQMNTNAFSTALYGLTGIHFAHIIFGVSIMALALVPAIKGRLSHSYARSMTMYVHFVNIMSIWVLAQVYYW